MQQDSALSKIRDRLTHSARSLKAIVVLIVQLEPISMLFGFVCRLIAHANPSIPIEPSALSALLVTRLRMECALRVFWEFQILSVMSLLMACARFARSDILWESTVDAEKLIPPAKDMCRELEDVLNALSVSNSKTMLVYETRNNLLTLIVLSLEMICVYAVRLEHFSTLHLKNVDW